MTALDVIEVPDERERWQDAGFRIDGTLSVGSTQIRTGAERIGLVLSDGAITDLDGIPVRLSTATPEPGREASPPSHPNTATGIDHIVVMTPDLDRTTCALEAIGCTCRRVRDTTMGDRPIQQRFFRLGPLIAEVVGPPEPDGSDRPATLWGLAIEVADMTTTAEVLGDLLGPVRPAVQPGRRIATLRTRDLGISVSIAFMTPEP